MEATLLYAFGPYLLDPYQRILLKQDVLIPLDPQAFEVLRVLVQHAGQIIRRDDLIDAAWSEDDDPGDSALSFQLYTLRRVLGDDHKKPAYIEVRRGRGVRFLSEVRTLAVNRPETITEADKLYMKGRHFWHKSSSVSVTKAVEYFERATAKDPNYAAAYAGLADSWILLGTFGHQSVPATVAMPKAKDAALKALALNKYLAEAHSAMAAVKALYEWKWDEAEKYFQTAVRLSTNPMTRAWYALCLAGRNDSRKAREVINEALDHAPASFVLLALSGRIHYLAREYERAVECCLQGIEVEEHFYLSYIFLGHTYRAQGNYSEALTSFESARHLTGDDPIVLAEIANINALLDDRDKSLALLGKVKRISRDRYVSPHTMGIIHIGLGNKDEAFKYLEKVYDERGAYLIFLTSEPIYDTLRTDVRMSDLIRRVGFASKDSEV